MFYYMKPQTIVDFEMNNITDSINISDIYNIKNNHGNHNIGILLAAGTSSRFDSDKPKQLYRINKIPCIMYSVVAMIDLVDELIIITNSNCLEEIKNLTQHNAKIIVLLNDINCRLESIGVSLNYIKNKYNNVNNIIVHDSARPFITHNDIKQLLISCDTYLYSQYYLNLVNGLYKKGSDSGDGKMVDRDQYIEICTPVAANFDLYYFIFMNYMNKQNRIIHEHISILDLLKIKYNLILGSSTHLRKITYVNDIIY